MYQDTKIIERIGIPIRVGSQTKSEEKGSRKPGQVLESSVELNIINSSRIDSVAA